MLYDVALTLKMFVMKHQPDIDCTMGIENNMRHDSYCSCMLQLNTALDHSSGFLSKNYSSLQNEQHFCWRQKTKGY